MNNNIILLVLSWSLIQVNQVLAITSRDTSSYGVTSHSGSTDTISSSRGSSSSESKSDSIASKFESLNQPSKSNSNSNSNSNSVSKLGSVSVSKYDDSYESSKPQYKEPTSIMQSNSDKPVTVAISKPQSSKLNSSVDTSKDSSNNNSKSSPPPPPPENKCKTQCEKEAGKELVNVLLCYQKCSGHPDGLYVPSDIQEPDGLPQGLKMVEENKTKTIPRTGSHANDDNSHTTLLTPSQIIGYSLGLGYLLLNLL